MKANYGLDQFDLEAMSEGQAVRSMNTYRTERCATRSQMKRKVLRGVQGARDRKGLVDTKNFTTV